MEPVDDGKPVREPPLVCEELDLVNVTKVLLTFDVNTAWLVLLAPKKVVLGATWTSSSADFFVKIRRKLTRSGRITDTGTWRELSVGCLRRGG